MSGWFYEINSNFYGYSADKMWVVLNNKKLYIYKNPFSNELKQTIDCIQIMDIVETVYTDLEIPFEGVIIRLAKPPAIEGGPTVIGELNWAWGDDATKVKGMWRSALIRHHHHGKELISVAATD